MNRLFIFLRAMGIVIFSTSSVYLIAHELYFYAILSSAGINIMWTLNVRDLSIAKWADRIFYVLGGVVGATLSLYGLNNILK